MPLLSNEARRNHSFTARNSLTCHFTSGRWSLQRYHWISIPPKGFYIRRCWSCVKIVKFPGLHIRITFIARKSRHARYRARWQVNTCIFFSPTGPEPRWVRPREKARVAISAHGADLLRCRRSIAMLEPYVRVPAELSTASPFLGYTRSELSFTFSVFDATLRGHREVGRVSSSARRRRRCM